MLKTALFLCFLKVAPPSDPPLVECLEALHRVVVSVFGQILDPETENDISTFEETFMGVKHICLFYKETPSHGPIPPPPQSQNGTMAKDAW